MALAAVRSEVVILLLMILCLLLLQLCWVLFYCLLLISLSIFGIESWLLNFDYVVVWLSVFIVSSPLVSSAGLWSLLLALLGHTHLFWAFLFSSA